MDTGISSNPGQECDVTIQEITLALVSHPCVAEASVVPCPLPDGGRQVVAFVVPRGADCSEEALRARLHTQLAGKDPLDKVVFLDALPRSVSGKVDRRRLEAGEFSG